MEVFLLKIPCAFLMVLGNTWMNEQLPDVGNNPAIRAEADGDNGKQRTSNRKKPTSNDCSKRPRK